MWAATKRSLLYYCGKGNKKNVTEPCKFPLPPLQSCCWRKLPKSFIHKCDVCTWRSYLAHPKIGRLQSWKSCVFPQLPPRGTNEVDAHAQVMLLKIYGLEKGRPGELITCSMSCSLSLSRRPRARVCGSVNVLYVPLINP